MTGSPKRSGEGDAAASAEEEEEGA